MISVSRLFQDAWGGRGVVAVVFAVAWLAGPARAEQVAETNESPQAFVQRLVERYRGVETFQCRSVGDLRFLAVKKPGMMDGDWAFHRDARLRFAAPNKFEVVRDGVRIVCDGRVLWQVSEPLMMYNALPLDDVRSQAGIVSEVEDYPTLGMLWYAHGGESPRLPPPVVEVQRVEQRERDGGEYRVIRCRVKSDCLWHKKPVNTDVWLNPATGWIDEFYFDVLGTELEEGGGQEQVEGYVKAVVSDVVVNEPIPDAAFTFTPDRRYTMSDAWWDADRVKVGQLGIIHEDATPLTWRDGDQEHALEDAAGRVVVLYFWSSACPPCVETLGWLQELQEAYGEDELRVVGVNNDSSVSMLRARDVLRERRITFPQVFDAEEKIAFEYGVFGRPSVVFVDRGGKVADVLTGPEIESEGTLKQGIDGLLEGRALIEAEALVDRIEALGGRVPSPNEEVKAERVLSLSSDAYQAETLVEKGRKELASRAVLDPVEWDCDGDGYLEAIVRAKKDVAYIVGGANGGVGHIPLEGTESFWSIVPVNLDGGRHWFVGDLGEVEPGGRWTSMATLYAPDGRLVWQFERPFPEDTWGIVEVDAADLDGDGAVEFVVCTSMELSETVVTVFDERGRVLGQKRMPECEEFLGVAAPDQTGRRAMVWQLVDELHRVYWEPRKEK